MNGMLSATTTVKLAKVIDVTVTDDTLAVDLEDGRTISVPIGWYPRLAHGTPEEQKNFQISGAGYGIHWPDLDEDIGVEGYYWANNPLKAHLLLPGGYNPGSNAKIISTYPCQTALHKVATTYLNIFG